MRARLRLADVDLHVQQLVGALDALGREHQADAHVHLGEIVDGDLSAAGAAASAGGRRLAQQRGLLGGHLLFERAHLRDGGLQLRCAGTPPRPRRSSARPASCPHASVVEAHRCRAAPACRVAPRSSPPNRGITGCEQRRGDAQRLGRGVERRVELLPAPPASCASFHGACCTMYLSTAESSAQIASRPLRELEVVESLRRRR